MGALSSNRNKRDASSQSSPSGSDYYYNNNNLHIAKKHKSLSFSPKDLKKVSRSSVSRLSLYPKNITRIGREMHAPCRFISGFLKRLFTYSSGIVRPKPVLYPKYSYVKETAAAVNDDVVEVIDVDNDDHKDGLGRSSVDVIEIVEDEREYDNVAVETQRIVDKYRALDRNRAFTGSVVGLEWRDNQGLPGFKKVLNEIDELRTMSLRRLRNLVKSVETKGALQQQSRPAKGKEDVENDPFRPLTAEEEDMVANALSYSNWSKVLVTHENSNITITGKVLQCLRPHAWLNDEVINLYLELLKERENREPKKFLKCHFFNTFFYKKLISGRTGYDYESVRRWTTQKKLGYGLLECDKIFVPIHKEVHWCLAVINKKEEKFQYLDSHGGADKKVLRMLAKYITDEVKDKTGKDIDVTSWEQEFVTDLPNQENGYDCGMFMIKYADFYSRDIGLCFKQEHMPYFRLSTAKEILKLRAN
ncbi:hypothetical protein M8C21_015873 [Ambrosia artemisiifolia]|uniref:Ubiquitin-like protease family profile domain-containing protein n=1 Tax=Ambrosia artemisiifolia TaxID=4212 RepID=A0AAD5D3B6_AMBAR|nr:hypothetical protein M8C21_015873 [Ambrosia artemisiifolia]